MFVVRENLELEGVRFLELSGKPTDFELTRYMGEERQRLDNTKLTPTVTILHVTDMWTQAQRTRMRQFEQEVSDKTQVEQIGMALIVTNRVIRGVFIAYYWLAGPKYPIRMLAAPEDAFDFVAERLSSQGLPVPEREEFLRCACDAWPARWNSDAGQSPLDAA